MDVVVHIGTIGVNLVKPGTGERASGGAIGMVPEPLVVRVEQKVEALVV